MNMRRDRALARTIDSLKRQENRGRHIDGKPATTWAEDYDTAKPAVRWTVTNWTDGPETETFDNRADAVDFRADTGGVLEGFDVANNRVEYDPGVLP